MVLVRRHLRLFAATWILFQATSLSALVPRACCLAHQMETLADCHEQTRATDTTAADAMPAMHHSHGHMDHAHGQPPAPKPAHDCALRGTCGGPAAALFALLSTDGVLTDPLTASVHYLVIHFVHASAD